MNRVELATTNLLAHLGCFVVANAMNEGDCRRLVKEALAATQEPASVRNLEDNISVDESYRKTKVAKLTRASRDDLRKFFRKLKPTIEERFCLTLSDCEPAQVLVYRKGDFFTVHKDQDDREGSKTTVSKRRVSVVLFLNGQSLRPARNHFCGGELNLFGLSNEPGWDDKGFPVRGVCGLLVGFRSNTFHEVTPVRHGKRVTAVTWYY